MPKKIFLNGLEDTFYLLLSEKLRSLGGKIVDSNSNSDISVGMGINSTGSVRIIPANQDFETHLTHERTLIEAAGTTEAFREGVAAFLEKRSPNFD